MHSYNAIFWVALVDTNCDPDNVSYVIPGNDDAIRSIKLIMKSFADSCIEGAQHRKTGGQEWGSVPSVDEKGPEIVFRGAHKAEEPEAAPTADE